MERKKSSGIDPWRDSACGAPTDTTRDLSRPAPEEGVRLMRAFMSVRQQALREAIIEFVAKLSKDESEGYSL